jgi:hypothetical protein
MRGYFGLSGFADHFVPGRTRWKQSGFSAEAFCFFGKSLFKRLSLFEMSTLHDTTSCLRVLTVGFTVPILICRRLAVSSQVNNSNQARVIFELGHQALSVAVAWINPTLC